MTTTIKKKTQCGECGNAKQGTPWTAEQCWVCWLRLNKKEYQDLLQGADGGAPVKKEKPRGCQKCNEEYRYEKWYSP